MKWTYKVVTTDTLFQRTDDHDIAVSKEAVNSRKINIQLNMEKELNKIGSDGWEFVSFMGEFAIFKKLAD
ncbi:MAG: hypothetical protein GTO02_00125 [Candidatus Dadabacteria bacterium]|nr:hypothetical protein [Candidatus Dadabacteria bacterium]NIQ12856.1 hypothetical protein [Candidatus Dadabacteria bacterium]